MAWQSCLSSGGFEVGGGDHTGYMVHSPAPIALSWSQNNTLCPDSFSCPPFQVPALGHLGHPATCDYGPW